MRNNSFRRIGQSKNLKLDGSAFGKSGVKEVQYDFKHVHGKKSQRVGTVDPQTGKFHPAIERRVSLVNY